MPEKISGADKLRHWLEETKTSQMALAAEMDVDQTAISKWVLGLARPRWAQLTKLFEITRGYVRPDDFMVGREYVQTRQRANASP